MWGFHPKVLTFDAANALRLGMAADLAYRREEVVTATAAAWGLDAKFISAGAGLQDTEAFVAGDAEIVIVAFRGTSEPEDFLADAKFAQVPAGWAAPLTGMVHQGFREEIQAAWPAVEAAVRAARDANQSLWLTGHSLGAALATIAAARLAAANVPVAGLYTFGSPRTGDQAFAASVEALIGTRTFRFVNHQDVVPRVPPESLGKLTYKHVGQLKYFDADGDLTAGPSVWEQVKERLANLDWARITAGNPSREELMRLVKEPLEDHAMACYLERLVQLAKV